jgi:transforming growth factor-beta-induced protein
VKKSFAVTIAGAVALAVTAAPSAVSAQVPDPLPDDSIAQVAETAGFTTLLAAAEAAGLDGVLADCDAGPFTVFAPTDAAFEALGEDLLNAALGDPEGLLTDILSYHIVPGYLQSGAVLAETELETLLTGASLAIDADAVTVNGIGIDGVDNLACNGVVHVIGEVLVPELPSIADIASGDGFSTLLAAVTAADLAGTLATCPAEQPLTVFAPTDAAFAAALEALDLTAEELLGNTELLTTVLTYHVVPGIVGAAEVLESTSLTTLQGENITVAGTVLNGSVNITGTNNWACNGVVHVIDAVLLPPSLAEPAPTTTVAPTTTTAPVTELPATGTENVVMALIATILVLAGAALVATRRRSTV